MGAAKIEQLPDPDLPEIAFAGRSNVGKSSLLNNNPSAANQGYGWFNHRDGVALVIQQEPEVNAQWDLLSGRVETEDRDLLPVLADLRGA